MRCHRVERTVNFIVPCESDYDSIDLSSLISQDPALPGTLFLESQAYQQLSFPCKITNTQQKSCLFTFLRALTFDRWYVCCTVLAL